MKRFLIVDHNGRNYHIDTITQEYLTRCRDHEIEWIFDLANKTFYDRHHNVWQELEEK